jgi:lactonase
MSARSLAPIPVSERDLPQTVAVPYFKVADKPCALEGPAFDRDGHLLFVDIYGGRLLRLSPQRELATVFAEPGLNPAGIAVHQDGRIFVAACGTRNTRGHFDAGTVIALSPNGSGRQTVLEPSAGYVPNDLVFDQSGGLYMSDFRGTSTRADGGVYYFAPDLQAMVAVLTGLSMANGVALSPDCTVLWATEFGACRLHRAELRAPGDLAQSGGSVPYHFIGPGPDSMRTDCEGNVYVAMNRQGRILIFSPYGIPIAQVLLPGREHNHFLRCTSLALAPDSCDMLIVARDEVGGGGTMVFQAQGLAAGTRLFSHQ